MDNANAVRLIDELGRVVLPAEVRQVLGWGERTPVDIQVDPAENEVVLRRHTPVCAFCGAGEPLKLYRKKPICPASQKAISALWPRTTQKGPRTSCPGANCTRI